MEMNFARRRAGRGTLLLLGIGVLLAPMIATGGTNGTSTPSAGSAMPAAAQPQTQLVPWTAVGSTGVVDEAALGIFAFGTTDVGYSTASASTASFFVRYNVTNTFDNNLNPNMPGWKILELGSLAPPGSEVRATFYRVNPCDGSRVRLCTVNNAGGGGPLCKICEFTTSFGPIDFSEYLYYVEVQMLRTATAVGGPLANPKAYTLRVY
jgi:hypothetical protein